MKRLLLLLSALALFSSPAMAQQVLRANGSATAASTACAAGNGCVTLVLPSGMSTATIQLTGTFVGTVQFEASQDSSEALPAGVTWNAILGTPIAGGAQVSSATSTGVWQFAIGAFTGIRVRVSAYTSGTVVANITASSGGGGGLSVTPTGSAATQVQGTAATGAAAVGNPVQAGGVDASGNIAPLTGTTGAPTGSEYGLIVRPLSTEDVAHGASDASTKPVKVGFKGTAADVTAEADGDRVNAASDLIGRQIVFPYARPENLLKGKTSDITGTSDTSVIAAQGAGVKIYVTHFMVTNSHASVSTWVNIKDGSTSIYTGFAHFDGGGFSLVFPSPLPITANTALNCAAETTGSNIRCSASGFKGY